MESHARVIGWLRRKRKPPSNFDFALVGWRSQVPVSNTWRRRPSILAAGAGAANVVHVFPDD